MKLSLALLAVTPWAALALSPPAGKPRYREDVLPIFRAHCFSCHGKEGAAAGLDLTSPKSLLKVVKPGHASESVLLHRLKGLGDKPQMPMGFAPLSEKQVKTIEDWIASGASTAGEEKQHWAYIAPVRPPAPSVSRRDWVRNPIDAFILARLEKGALAPSKPASKETLLRRVSLDLIGLPPTVEEMDAFLADRSPEAYEKAVDRLLASPHYGERMARPWLDLARYADSDGYEKDLSRRAWKYRDWVIDAYNRNLPFDRFTIEQLAGDMLPQATIEQQVATGFHRNTMQNLEGGVDQAEAHFTKLIDRTDTTALVWLGSTVACARCHDHKYDPIKQTDYYRLLAVFSNTEVVPQGDAKVSEEKWLEPEIETGPAEAIQERDRLKKAGADAKAIAEVQARIETAMVLREKKGRNALKTNLRIRGEFLNLGEEVQAGPPSFLPPAQGRFDRLALARWLVDRKNPLTARVQANRIWEQHFGKGLVETSEDFGTQGSRPSHPGLLDWLAVEFMESGWDMKALHRLIVTSSTYRQGSNASRYLLQRDPANVLLARGPRVRLEAEMIRDNALAVSGLLDRKVGGPSVMPDQPEGVWDSPYSGEQWNRSKGGDRWRRGIYTFWKRTSPYPAFMAFDATSRESCTPRRVLTNTPLQALALLNDPAMLEAAKAMASLEPAEIFRRATGRQPNPAERIRLQTLKFKMLDQYRKDPKAAAKLAPSPELAAGTMVANAVLNLDEVITRE